MFTLRTIHIPYASESEMGGGGGWGEFPLFFRFLRLHIRLCGHSLHVNQRTRLFCNRLQKKRIPSQYTWVNLLFTRFQFYKVNL